MSVRLVTGDSVEAALSVFNAVAHHSSLGLY